MTPRLAARVPFAVPCSIALEVDDDLEIMLPSLEVGIGAAKVRSFGRGDLA